MTEGLVNAKVMFLNGLSLLFRVFIFPLGGVGSRGGVGLVPSRCSSRLCANN